MAMYISLDAGGTKCNAILFDDELKLLGRGLSGGVNTTQTSLADSRANMAACLDQLFAQCLPERIERIYLSLVGPVELLKEELSRRTQVEDIALLGEPKAGLLAGALCREGLLAIAGTGSDVFYICNEPHPQRRTTVGAWGPILGDQGSGTWIGQRALRAIVKGIEGWAPETVMLELLRDEWQMTDNWDMVRHVHDSVAPFREVASVTHIVGRAASMGDKVACDILRAAGDVMAEQVLCLLNRVEVRPEHRQLTCCGGAWKTHRLMYETFHTRLAVDAPQISVNKPYFEHVMAGPALLLLERGLTHDETLRLLRTRFPDYIIGW